MTLPFDSVYFFMFAGWRTEARSNRWHYGRRWARQAPVVFLQPELARGAPWRHEPAMRLENVEILSIQQSNNRGIASFDEGLAQARQIKSYMKTRGHCRPLFWIYNPFMTFAAALVPSCYRIFHATENYFDTEAERSDLADLKRSLIAISDKVICCSSGVLDGCRAATGREDLDLIPNGCDYQAYAAPKISGGGPEPLRALSDAGVPIAVFAGNINNRLNFGLMTRLAAEIPEIGFAYAGAVAEGHLEPCDLKAWNALLERPNVLYLGVLDADELPRLYHSCDRGFIPYRHLPYIVKNGLPLKTLEMAAAGLPVVASSMEPLRRLPDAVAVADDDAAFVAELRRASRRTRTAEAAARADSTCRAHDYDRLFERMLDTIVPNVPDDPPLPAALAPIYVHLGLDRALRDAKPEMPYRSKPAAEPRLAAGAEEVALARRPRHLQAALAQVRRAASRRLPMPLKAAIRRSLGL